MKALSSSRNDSSGLFQPLVGGPVLAVSAFGHAQFALVEQVDHGHDGILDLRIDIARRDIGAAFKSVFDGFLQVLHDGSL